MTYHAKAYPSRTSSAAKTPPAPRTLDSVQEAFRANPCEQTAKAYVSMAKRYHDDELIGDSTLSKARKDTQSYLARASKPRAAPSWPARTPKAGRDGAPQRAAGHTKPSPFPDKGRGATKAAFRPSFAR